jgi:hypothetical protein
MVSKPKFLPVDHDRLSSEVARHLGATADNMHPEDAVSFLRRASSLLSEDADRRALQNDLHGVPER